MKPICLIFTAIALHTCMLCNSQTPASTATNNKTSGQTQTSQTTTGTQKKFTANDIQITKELLYDKYTLKDTYKYQNKERSFKWDKIKEKLAYIENIQLEKNVRWAVLQNYKNLNREAPLVHKYRRNAYKRIADTLGVERYQSAPLYLPSDTLTPERYGPDGTIVKRLPDVGSFAQVAPITIDGKWLVPKRYVKNLADTTVFHHAIFIDRGDQNIATLERTAPGKWVVRSMNPATTGRHKPPYAQETPLGMFLLQEKKSRMVFLKDGSKQTGGYAPYASRFTNGAYIHGVPVNVPRTSVIEYSYSLGTTPRSHMCVRNATSHSKFVYEWAPTRQTIVIVIE